MKRLCALLLLASLALLALSCTKPENPPTEQPNEVTSPLVGVWYAENDQLVLELRADGSYTRYALKAGYYAYVTTENGTYTEQDSSLTLHRDAVTVATLLYDADTLTEDHTVYTRTELGLPVQHPKLILPDFTAIDALSIVKLSEKLTFSAPADATAQAAYAIFNEIYVNTLQKPTVSEDRAAVEGDYVNIDYAGYLLDGTAFDGGTAKGQDVLISSNSGYIPGFAEQIATHKVGEEFDVPVTFPENYGSADMAGKSVIFKMKLNAIYDLGAVSDEAVANKTNNVYTSYKDYLDAQESLILSSHYWNTLLSEITLVSPIPQSLYGYFLQRYEETYHEYAFYYGIEYEYFLSLNKITQERFVAQAKQITVSYLAAYALAEQQGLSIKSDMDEMVTDAQKWLWEHNQSQAQS